VMKALKEVLQEKYHHLLPVNEEALRLGATVARELAEPVV
jgi:2-oxoglutarate ferredoxin oxidoreductase subunit gamma